MGSNFKHVLDIFSTPLMKPILFSWIVKVSFPLPPPPPFSLYHPLLCQNVFLLILWQTCLIKEGMHVLKTNSERKFLWQTLHVWLKNVKQIKDISFLTMASKAHTKSDFSRTPPMFKEPLKLNSHWKVSVSQRKKRELDNRHLMHVITLLNTINIFRPTNACKLW